MKKVVIYFFVISILTSYCSCGSYSSSEKYLCNLSSEEFIQRLNDFLNKNPQYKCTQSNDKGEIYDRGLYYSYSDEGENEFSTMRTDSSVFYSFYIHFSDIKTDVHCVINVSEQNDATNNCTIKLIGVTYSSNWSVWKTINNNKEISSEENELIKEKFKTEIMNQICFK